MYILEMIQSLLSYSDGRGSEASYVVCPHRPHSRRPIPEGEVAQLS